MKKQAMMMALLSAGLIGQNVYALSSTSNIEWVGVVPGGINGDQIGLTGQNGGTVNQGELAITQDGAFTTRLPVILEAHEMVDDGTNSGNLVPGPKFYSGDVDWTLGSVYVTNPAYDTTDEVNDVKIVMNGHELSRGTPVTIAEGLHQMQFSASSEGPSNGSVLPNQTVVATATIFAEGNGGSL
ncbi:hypothetical protein HAS37_20190 [Vibrio campbellii]|uniref:Uncharacterized protein n=5 Tax=Vibrio campbellii TaxID=680 RepID=A7N7J5_VIBC1|nr:hypothetical protein [Vibrio campbellii]ABU74999.1 hypothetical protein VIBHAR_07127 [Vibrio campbellii ATCC BAA-1116]AGU98957.1 hypothetical protein M892_27385 [Vibrio campbellii ATCC BAA-1116]MBT0148950.1 hypothetical protein [Vibrio campbellii]MBT0182759.1 hypothetical protein [Vibrio campbellii]MBT0228841.1 hypothetical protein [Vibrio campbellii]